MTTTRSVTSALALAALLLTLVPAAADASTRGGRPATLRDFAGAWAGHTRDLEVSRKGVVVEHVGSGCCDPVLDLTVQLSDVRGTRDHASARAEVVAVSVLDPSAYDGQHPAPRVGDVTRFKIRGAVLKEPFSRTVYCDPDDVAHWVCGA